jgi:casein kinase II subunit alpha
MNLVLNFDTKDLKIIDWGLAEFYVPGNKLHHRVATRYYKSPEILMGMEDYHYALDIWSLGCIFAELILRKVPFFQGSDNTDQLLKIVQVLGTDDLYDALKKYNLKLPADFLPKLNKYLYYFLLISYKKKPFTKFINEKNLLVASKEALDLLTNMLKFDPNERITAREALYHSYFN